MRSVDAARCMECLPQSAFFVPRSQRSYLELRRPDCGPGKVGKLKSNTRVVSNQVNTQMSQIMSAYNPLYLQLWGGGAIIITTAYSLPTAWCKKFFPCLKFPPYFCQAKWPAHAQPIGPDGTCVTKLSSINFARPCFFFKILFQNVWRI